jgi:hypothetical protein
MGIRPTYTGILGIPSSRLGSLVPGVTSLWAGLGTFDYNVHAIAANKIRVLYNDAVTDSALNLAAYVIASLPTLNIANTTNNLGEIEIETTVVHGLTTGSTVTITGVGGTIEANGTWVITYVDPTHFTLNGSAYANPWISGGTVALAAVVPIIESIEYYDETVQSVILNLSSSLTFGTSYSLIASGVFSIHGEEVLTGAKNFTANVLDPPIAIGAWQSKRGCIDILFDRSVGPTSSLATFTIRDASVTPPGVLMSQLPWVTEGIPETVLRITLPGGMPAANSYVIDFVDVTDVSLNTATNTVPLTLAPRVPTPYSYAVLTQLQITDAFITDVSNDGLNTGNIRVYFNGPVSNADVEVNWAAYQSGVHIAPDTANNVISPDPGVSIPLLIALVNEIKLDFNNHIIEYHSHQNIDVVNTVLSPDAIDLSTIYALVNEEQTKYLAHLTQPSIHVYDDIYHEFIYENVSSHARAVVVAIDMRNKYNDHAQIPEYPLVFNNSYGPSITAYTKYLVPNNIIDTLSPYVSYADLKFYMDSSMPRVRLEAILISEDGFSVTVVNPLDPLAYTGNIVARSQGSDSVSCLSLSVLPEESVSLCFDRNVIVSSDNGVRVLDQNEIFSPPITVSTSLPAVIWALNNAITVYNMHISSVSMHKTPDAVNNISSLVGLPISSIIIVANTFKTKLNAHMVNNFYHYFSDSNVVRTPNASDMMSLVNLTKDIQKVCIEHITKEPGPHYVSSSRMISAPLDDIVILSYPKMVNNREYAVFGNLQSSYYDNGAGDLVYGVPSGVNYRVASELNATFIGLATRPSLASAVPRVGLIVSDTMKLVSDSVEVFFSKPMHKLSLSLSNLVISGGSIIQKEANWMGNDRASVQVTNMGTVSYTVIVTNLTDEAGNLIY